MPAAIMITDLAIVSLDSLKSPVESLTDNVSPHEEERNHYIND